MNNRLHLKATYTEERLKQLEEFGLTTILPVNFIFQPNIIFKAFEPKYDDFKTEIQTTTTFKCIVEVKEAFETKLNQKSKVNSFN